jgi:hypothetical protein
MVSNKAPHYLSIEITFSRAKCANAWMYVSKKEKFLYLNYCCILETAFFTSSKFIAGCISTLASNP